MSATGDADADAPPRTPLVERRLARAAGILALCGGTLGIALDAAHVHSGTTAYAHPTALGIAWWAVPLFSSAAVALGLGPVLAERALGRHDAPPTMRAALGGMALMVAAYLVSCAVDGVVGAVILLAFGAAIAAVVDRRPLGLAMAAAAAIAGPVVEIVLVRAGFFMHAETELFGVAAWLPALYVCVSLGTSGLARALAARD